MAGESEKGIDDFHIIEEFFDSDGYEIRRSGIIMDEDEFMWVAGKNIISAGLVENANKYVITTPALVLRINREYIKNGTFKDNMAQQIKAMCSQFYDDLLKAGFDPQIYEDLFGGEAYLTMIEYPFGSLATPSVKPRECTSDMNQDQAPATSSVKPRESN